MHPFESAPPTPQANLDVDSALFQQAEQAGELQAWRETLRFWECSEHCVVLGRSCNARDDVHLEACELARIPVLHRPSGGGTVLLGPGCLNFSLVLSLEQRPALRMVRDSMEIILATMIRGLALEGVRHAGISDLTYGGLKFSGNAQRRGRWTVLHHGTILHGFSISRVSEFLREPARQPAYRQQRSHEQFLCNIPLDASQIQERIAHAWLASPR